MEAGVLQAKSLDVQTGTIGVKQLGLRPATVEWKALIWWGWGGVAKVSATKGCVGWVVQSQLLGFPVCADQASCHIPKGLEKTQLSLQTQSPSHLGSLWNALEASNIGWLLKSLKNSRLMKNKGQLP